MIVGDIFKAKGVFVEIIDDAVEVIKWFNNHSRALGLLKKVQLAKIGKILALLKPVLTRWTSHYLAIRRLVQLEIPFKQLLLDHSHDLLLAGGRKREEKERAEYILEVLGGYGFWANLRK